MTARRGPKDAVPNGSNRRYKLRNWPAYNAALKKRGSITVWFSEEAIEAWHPPHGGTKGGQYEYSDVAIDTALTIRLVFKSALRQTEGFLDSLIRIMGLNIKAPNFSTLSRRGKNLDVRPLERLSDGPVNLLVDSSGLKIYGDGEWTETKHGLRRRRRWRKLHIGASDGDLELVACTVTTDDVGDASEVPGLLDQVEGDIASFKADGAYDHQAVYDAAEARGGMSPARVVIPPRKNAVLSENADTCPSQRDRHINTIRVHGREAWEIGSGYGRRLLVENAIYRYKTIIGRELHARDLSCQQTESKLACKAINKMTRLGMPDSYCIG